MSNIKVRKINLNVYHFEAKLNSDMSFTLTFFGKREKAKDENRLEIRMTFKFYWLQIFKTQFKKVAQSALERVKDTGFMD